MPRPKQILKRSVVEVAQRKRTCKFSNQPISKGESCLVVFDGPRERFCYSADTAVEMIKMARAKLDEIEESLRS